MKKGFTLVELLAVIVVMGIVAAIGFMSVSSVIESSKESTYKEQKRAIENAAKEWAVENIGLLPDMSEGSGSICVSVSQLKVNGNLSNIPENPRTGEAMNGCVNITYNYSNKQYTYTYREFVITNDATYPWTNYDGLYMSTNRYQSSSVQNNTTTSNLTFSFTITDTATLSFEWSVSSESASYDYIYYTIKKDGTVLSGTGTSTKIGGISYGGPTTSNSDSVTNIYNPNSDPLTYTTVTKELSAGTYQVTFTYRKDISANKGYDAGFVKNFNVSY